MSCHVDYHFKRNIDFKVKDLAHYCGITEQAAYLILDSKRSPNVYTALKFMDFFNDINEHVLRTPGDPFFQCYINVEDLFLFDEFDPSKVDWIGNNVEYIDSS